MIIRRMRFACWITKNADKQIQSMLYLLLVQDNKDYANVPSSNFIPTYTACKVVYTVHTQLITGH